MPENPLHALYLEATPQDFARLFKTPPQQAIEAWEKRTLAPKPSRKEQEKTAKGIPNPRLPWKSTDVLWHGCKKRMKATGRDGGKRPVRDGSIRPVGDGPKRPVPVGLE